MLEPLHTNDQLDLSIIIVSWNVRDLLRQCLASIDERRTQMRLEVIVVDSASSDNSVHMVRQEFPWIKVSAQPENVGFPKGNNIGLRNARGRHALLLNPDTVVRGGALEKMVAFLDSHPDVGVVGPRLRYPDGTIQSSRRRFPSLLTAFFESTWLEPWAPSGVIRSFRALDLPEGKTVDVDWVTGAAMMVRGTVIEQVGHMDEAYFMYSEELDWCRRIKEYGWRVVYYPVAEVVHYEGKSSEQAVTARHINFQRAKLRYFRKHHGRLACAILRMFLLTSYVGQLFLEGLKWLLGHQRALRRQRVSAYWQVLQSGLRPAGY